MVPKQIVAFDKKWYFLSNFCWFDAAGKQTTVEHHYQASKTVDPTERAAVLACATPGQAKRMGKHVTLRADWEAAKIPVMYSCLAWKFTPGTELADLLLSTGDAYLIEGNTWNDRYWGAVWDGKEFVGENHLGLLLMKWRAVLAMQ